MIILIEERKIVGEVTISFVQRLPPVRGYIDDIATVPQTAACKTRLLKLIYNLVGWKRINNKPAKACSLSSWTWVRNYQMIFVAGKGVSRFKHSKVVGRAQLGQAVHGWRETPFFKSEMLEVTRAGAPGHQSGVLVHSYLVVEILTNALVLKWPIHSKVPSSLQHIPTVRIMYQGR